MNYSMDLKVRASALQQRILAACHTAQRSASDVRLIWISKTRTLEEVQAAHTAGARDFGENRVQEVVDKFSQPLPHSDVHIIGPIQSNKLRKAAQLAQWIHSVDRIDQLIKLDSLAKEFGKTLDILFQVNTSGEDSKSGIDAEAALLFLKEIPSSTHLRYRGLMTIGPNSGNPEDAREGFAFLRELRDRFVGTTPMFADFRELSMGMSDDLEVAIAEGSTMLRVGTALFGARSYAS